MHFTTEHLNFIVRDDVTDTDFFYLQQIFLTIKLITLILLSVA